MKKILLITLFLQLAPSFLLFGNTPEIRYVNEISNVRHPQIGYWFFTPDIVSSDAYLDLIEEYSKTTPYNLIVLTARNGMNFFDVEKMHPVFERLVHKADSLGIGIGLSIWDCGDKEYTERNCARTIIETETRLDASGKAICSNKAANIRSAKPYKHELLKVYAFKKVGDGVYEPGTLHDITKQCVQAGTPENFSISIDAGEDFAGYDVYAMSEIYYQAYCVYSSSIGQRYYKFMEAYSDIPFKGIALDEFSHMRVDPPHWNSVTDEKPLPLRHYSLAMKAEYRDLYNRDLDEDLLSMRYAPQNDDTEKIRAINCYMDLMRKGPLESERAIIRYARRLFGQDIFIGFHNTYHNDFDNDEIWTTGINWWTLPRDYGHSDEGIVPGIQVGIGMSYVQKVMYNMYYHKNIDSFASKALTDLRYGVRTIYHAINDKGKFGIPVEDPDFAGEIAKVERMAVLANRLDATFADARILVVAGMEALSNWYPDRVACGAYYVNKTLRFQDKSREMWNAGYLNAVVSSDLIENGTLFLNEQNKPTLNGYTFDAVVYLNPQYARTKTLRFISDYAKSGGRILVEGIPQKDFYANDLTDWWNGISDRVKAVGYSLENVGKLGVKPNPYPNGNNCVDNTVVLTDYESLKNNTQTEFSITVGNHLFTGTYQGYVAVRTDANNRLSGFAAGACGKVYCDGKLILKLKSPADIVLVRNKKEFSIIVSGIEQKNKLSCSL